MKKKYDTVLKCSCYAKIFWNKILLDIFREKATTIKLCKHVQTSFQFFKIKERKKTLNKWVAFFSVALVTKEMDMPRIMSKLSGRIYLYFGALLRIFELYCDKCWTKPDSKCLYANEHNGRCC